MNGPPLKVETMLLAIYQDHRRTNLAAITIHVKRGISKLLAK